MLWVFNATSPSNQLTNIQLGVALSLDTCISIEKMTRGVFIIELDLQVFEQQSPSDPGTFGVYKRQMRLNEVYYIINRIFRVL